MFVRDRMSSHEPPGQTTFINLSEPAPQLMIILPNGYVVSYESIRAMDPENRAAWFDNMMNSEPDDIEPRASDQDRSCSTEKRFYVHLADVFRKFFYVHLADLFRKSHNLPDCRYPIPTTLLGEFSRSDNPSLELLIFGLQTQSEDDPKSWKEYEPQIDMLAKLLAKHKRRNEIVATGNNWRLEIGPVDLNGKIVTIQRSDELIAALSPTSDGRLRVSAFRALDAKSLRYLISLGQVPHPETGICMRENNWEYALDSSAPSFSKHYADERDEAYLSFWEKGIGISTDGTEVEIFRPYKDHTPRRPEWVAAELAVYDLYRS